MYEDSLAASNGFDEDGEMNENFVVKGEAIEEKDSGPFEFQELDEIDGGPISEEDAWTVISAHFEERGLVGQQLDSFDNFMTSTMQVSSKIIKRCKTN